VTMTNSRKTLLLGALFLLSVAAIVRLGGSIYSFNKFRRTHLTVSSSAVRKDPANYSELPDVDFSRLSEKQKQEARQRLNVESCTCGCKLTVADCRLNDSTCPLSKALAAQVVDQVRK
jgi:hypothetical protein